jgi:hypothetical protein
VIEKRFTISNWEGNVQSVSVTEPLGRILLRDEIKVIAASYGSEVKTSFNSPSVDIVPPIPAKKQAEFGEALVKLAQELDPAEPSPTYQIT